MAKSLEHNFQTKVLAYLTRYAAPDVFWFAVPNAGRRTMRASARLRAEGMTRGVPDLIVMLPSGKTGWLELKSPEGRIRMTDEQKGFAARCWRLGHNYACLRNMEEVQEILTNWGATRAG